MCAFLKLILAFLCEKNKTMLKYLNGEKFEQKKE